MLMTRTKMLNAGKKKVYIRIDVESAPFAAVGACQPVVADNRCAYM